MKDYTIPVKLEKHLRKNKKAWSRRGMIAILTYSIALIVMGVIGKSCWDGYWRTHSWRFQTPIILQNPLIITEVKPEAILPVISAENAPEGKLEAKKTYPDEWEQAYKTVRLHESSNGRATGLNGHCIEQHGLNEIGFAPYQKYCFKDQEDQHDTFMLWVKNRLGIPCVKTGFCRATIPDLLLMYSNGAYSELL